MVSRKPQIWLRSTRPDFGVWIPHCCDQADHLARPGERTRLSIGSARRNDGQQDVGRHVPVEEYGIACDRLARGAGFRLASVPIDVETREVTGRHVKADAMTRFEQVARRKRRYGDLNRALRL